jgi:RimJ/RimL family protein N-acetyltransferase
VLDLARIPVLHTTRLRLRGPRGEDLVGFAGMMADPEVARLKGFEGGASREQCWAGLARILGHWALRGVGLFAVEERESNAFVGMVGVIEPLGWPGPELTWTIARPHWNRGIATEAAVAVLGWAAETLPVRDLVSMIPPANGASRRVAEKIGGCRRGEIGFGGEVVELYGYERQRAAVEVASV